jgi:uncharacterized protein YbjT (DUF2867 family)
MRVLVLGGYGLIGREIVRRLTGEGLHVTGFGRSLEKGRAAAPDIDWIVADLATWTPELSRFDAIVNAAGALQASAKDDLAAVQERAIVALIEACETASCRFPPPAPRSPHRPNSSAPKPPPMRVCGRAR